MELQEAEASVLAHVHITGGTSVGHCGRWRCFLRGGCWLRSMNKVMVGGFSGEIMRSIPGSPAGDRHLTWNVEL